MYRGYSSQDLQRNAYYFEHTFEKALHLLVILLLTVGITRIVVNIPHNMFDTFVRIQKLISKSTLS